MTLASYLLLAIGVLGAADILFFHTVVQRIHHNSASQKELWTHALRGPTYALLFLGVPNLGFQGGWFWGLMGLLVFDLGVSVVDFALEK